MSRLKLLIPLLLSTFMPAFSQSAPAVTNLSCTNKNGQTFCTYTEPSSDPNWTSYRFQLYGASTPIASVAGMVPLETNILDNGGYLDSTAAYTQVNRTAPGARMSTITTLGTPLPFGTGLAVYTTLTNGVEYYAVVTVDRRGILAPSTVTLGVNSLTSPVTETVAPIQPVLQIASIDSASGTPPVEHIPSNTTGLAGWFYLHGSGGNMPSTGDYWAFWGDSTMGIHDGVQQVGRVYYNKSGFGQPALYMAPQDRAWYDIGTSSLETYWNGFDYSGQVQQYTQHWLDAVLSYWVSYYGLDPNRIYGHGKSMGAMGQTYWGLRQSAQPFAAIFAEAPVWWIEGNVTSMTQHKTIKTKTELIAAMNVTYYNNQNTPSMVTNCSFKTPPVIWSNGRNDISFPNYSMWTNAVAAANAMIACHRPYAFGWTNGGHSDTNPAEQALLTQYETAYVLNVSYPVFTNFSLDSNFNGTDCDTGTTAPICFNNYGWKWNVTSDTAHTWSGSFSNSQVTAGTCPTLKCSSTATVDLSVGNAQQFLPAGGKTISWSTSSGQSGTVTPDQYGIVTIPGISLGTGSLTVSLSY